MNSKLGRDTIAIEESSDEEKVLTQEPLQPQESIGIGRPRREIRKPVHFVDMVVYASPIVNDDIPATYNKVV